jgi:hypothetical protein
MVRRKDFRDCNRSKVERQAYLSLSLRCRYGEMVRREHVTIASESEAVRRAFISLHNKRITCTGHLKTFGAFEVVHSQSKNAMPRPIIFASEFEIRGACPDVDSESDVVSGLSGGAVGAINDGRGGPT